jgi:hypothetical protein
VISKKIVQANSTLQNIRVSHLVNDERYRDLLPDFEEKINVDIKMLKPTRTIMCNQ